MNRITVAGLLSILLFLAGCAAAPSGSVATAADPPAVKNSGIELAMFEGEELGGLIFRVNQVSATSSLNRAEDMGGGYAIDRRFTLVGAATDPTGSLSYRLTRVEVDRLRDESGRDLLRQGTPDVRPIATRSGAVRKPSGYPGNATNESFSIGVSNLDRLPTSLSELAARVYAEVPGEMTFVDIPLEASEKQIEPVPGLKVRIRRFREERNSITGQLEYQIERTPGKPPPIVLSAAIHAEERQLIQEGLNPNEFPSRNTIMGILPIRAMLTDPKPAVLRLHLSVDIKEVCFQINEKDVPLAR
jgi:hypothetical protein